MIDGVKIYLPYLNYLIWKGNPLLNFSTKVCEETGEIIGVSIAKYQGLEFRIIPSRKYKGQYNCEIVGSLHRYHNKGSHNDNAFSFMDLQIVIHDLKAKFNVVPTLALIQNIEFGVNVNTPVTVSKFCRSLVVCSTDELATINDTRKPKVIGKQVLKTQYRYKIYDKGYTANNGQNNLLRVEYKATKMECLKSYGIKTLADLQCVDTVGRLLKKVLFKYDQFIYWDKAINRRKLTTKQSEKYQYYGNATNWLDFDHHKQRQRAKEQYKSLLDKASTSTVFADVRQLIADKWHELLGAEPQFKPIPKVSKPTTKKYCECCGTDIFHKKESAKYCSKLCNNKLNGMRKTQHLQYTRKQEHKQLEKLNKVMQKNRLWLWVTYKDDNTKYSDYLHQSEIQASRQWINKVRSISVEGYRINSLPIALTSVRAKQFLQTLNQYNNGKSKA